MAGDTASDVESGLRAGAGIVAGVLTGAGSRADLEQAGAPLILDTIADLLPHVTGLTARRRLVQASGLRPCQVVRMCAQRRTSAPVGEAERHQRG